MHYGRLLHNKNHIDIFRFFFIKYTLFRYFDKKFMKFMWYVFFENKGLITRIPSWRRRTVCCVNPTVFLLLVYFFPKNCKHKKTTTVCMLFTEYGTQLYYIYSKRSVLVDGTRPNDSIFDLMLRYVNIGFRRSFKTDLIVLILVNLLSHKHYATYVYRKGLCAVLRTMLYTTHIHKCICSVGRTSLCAKIHLRMWIFSYLYL